MGDWGTAFGMLIAYMKDTAPDVLTGKKTTDLTHLVDWYRASKKQFDEDPQFKKNITIGSGGPARRNPDALHAWEIICDISRKAYQEIYDLLDVTYHRTGRIFL